MPPSHREVVKALGIKPASQEKLRMLNRARLEAALRTAAKKKTVASQRAAARLALEGYDDDEKKRLSIEAYSRLGTLGDAARSVGVLRSTLERWIIDDPVYREEIINAHEEVIDSLEKLAFKRAKGTSDTPGSDDLLKFLLRANRPGKFSSAPGGAVGAAQQQKREEEEQRSQAQRQKFLVAGQEIEF